MRRSGLRQEDINKLVRSVRASRASGLGPDEAWASAMLQCADVEEETLTNWRAKIEEKANEAPPPPSSATNLLDKNQELTDKVVKLQRALADAGAREETLQKENEELKNELEQMNELLQSGEKKKGK